MPRPVNLSLELLRTFTKVIECEGDALRAAERLDINQPSMSKRLRYLQHAGPVLQIPWLWRDGKTWRATDKGREVLPAVQEIVQRFDHLKGLAGAKPPPHAKPKTTVTFACGQLAATGLAREVMHAFRKHDRDTRIRITTPRGNKRVRGVAMGSYDMALVTHDEAAIYPIAHRRLHVEVIETDHLALICAKHFKAEHDKVFALKDGKVKPRDLIGLPLILPEPDAGLRRILDRVFKAEGVYEKLDVVLEIGGWKVILDSVRDRLGVGIVSEAVLIDAKDVTIRRLDPHSFPPSKSKLICRFRLDRPEELDLSQPAGEFRKAIIEAAEKRAEVLRNR